MIRLAFATAVGLAAGFLAGQLAGESRAAPAATAATPAQLAPTVVTRVDQRALTPADIALLKRELAEVVSCPEGRSEEEEQKTAAAPEPESPERIAADAKVRSLLDRALAAGVWTDEDAAALRELVVHASPAMEREALETIIAGLNNRRLLVLTQGPPI